MAMFNSFLYVNHRVTTKPKSFRSKELGYPVVFPLASEATVMTIPDSFRAKARLPHASHASRRWNQQLRKHHTFRVDLEAAATPSPAEGEPKMTCFVLLGES